jgi:NuA3 HAT complex component NTO1
VSSRSRRAAGDWCVTAQPLIGPYGSTDAQICYLCKKRVGACIQCSNRACFTAFHVTCARDYGLHLRLKVQSADYKAFCHKHEPREMGAAELVELTEEELATAGTPGASHQPIAGTSQAALAARKRKRGDDPLPPPKPEKRVRATPKTSRAYSKTFASGPPIIPFYIHTRLWEYVDRVKIRNKKAFVAMACRYWSLKREARRGAPLLKRLHLEPWTAAAANGQQSDAEKAKKLKVRAILRERRPCL